jgi:hypothetical protein
MKNNNSNYNYIVDNKYQCDNLSESNARYGLTLLIFNFQYNYACL